MTRYWFDTEFMEDGERIELLSIGVVCEDGREFYAESLDADHSHANEWVRDNVLPHLWSRQPDKRAANSWSRDGGTGGLLSRARIAGDLLKFVNAGEAKPEFWAYYGDYDWVVLCQLYGRMIDLPKSWPMFALDVKQLCVSVGDPRLPEQTSTEHNALEDARWTRLAWEFLASAAAAPAPDAAEHGAGGPGHPMTDVVQCPASGVLVDHDVPLHVTELVCPACGLLVPLGGTPKAPRYTIHNEPPSLGDAIAAYYAADEVCGGERRERAIPAVPQGRPVLVAPNADLIYACSPHGDDGDAVQREVDRADDHMLRHEDDDFSDFDGGSRQAHVTDLRDRRRGIR